MSSGRSRLLLRLLPPALFLAAFGCRTVDSALTHAHLPCGLYRWPVKTLADPDAGAVHWKPIDTTVKHLTQLPRPAEVHRKERTPYEYYVYRVQALLVAVHPQVDQDVHILLRDPDDPSVKMLAEIPSPLCTSGSALDSDYVSARKVARSLRHRKDEVLVEITGVGFFDALRKRGSARNGFELHPVLQLAEVRPEATPSPEPGP